MNQSDFFKDVFEVVRLIPAGRVTSYGAIARYLGSAGSSRLVGYAMNASHFQDTIVPAHRVVNRVGLLSGRAHFNPPEKMEQLLMAEGVIVEENKVKEFDKVFWDPLIELSL